MNKKKIIGAIAGAFIPILFLLLPLIMALGAVAVPFAVVGSIFSSIGDFFGPDNDVVVTLESYFSSKDSKAVLANQYQPIILSEKDVQIPVNYLIIPNIIVGLEYPTDDQWNFLINSSKKKYEEEEIVYDEKGKPVKDKEGNVITQIVIKYELRSVEDYIEIIKYANPYSEYFSSISTSTIAKYINHFSYLNVYHLDPSEIPEGDFMYPFKEKAIVTAEMGYYRPFGELEWHDAIDLAFPSPNQCGKPIYSVSDGKVVNVQFASGKTLANHIIVDVGNGIRVKYVHMRDNYSMPVGHDIKKGEYIGAIGSTGISTGCHLHLNFKLNGKDINPRTFIDFN